MSAAHSSSISREAGYDFLLQRRVVRLRENTRLAVSSDVWQAIRRSSCHNRPPSTPALGMRLSAARDRAQTTSSVANIPSTHVASHCRRCKARADALSIFASVPAERFFTSRVKSG